MPEGEVSDEGGEITGIECFAKNSQIDKAV
jgi:hypothetical protein